MPALNIHAQTDISKYVGKYGDWMPGGEALTTELELKPNGTFTLRTVDYVYPQTFEDYTNQGNWILKDGEVFLNPGLKRREPVINVIEKQIGGKDSIEIKVNHYVELYENEILIGKKKTDFDILTLYFNKKRNYKHLVKKGYNVRRCIWAPRIRNRVNLDSAKTFKIAKTSIEKIGVYTYGFTTFLELETQNPESDYFEIDIIVPVDKERMPRNKKVIIKGKKAYFYEVMGELKKSLNPLYRKTV